MTFVDISLTSVDIPLYPVYACRRVNRGVFDVMAKLWSHRSTAAGLPQQDPLKYPDMPSTSYRLLRDGGALYARGGPLTKVEKGAVLLERDDIRRMNRNMASIAATHKIKWQVSDGGTPLACQCCTACTEGVGQLHLAVVMCVSLRSMFTAVGLVDAVHHSSAK